jgi:hypothetical protein
LAAINHGFYLTPWKLIRHKNGKRELFHLQNDPLELVNRAMGEDKVLEELTEKLRGWVAQNLGGERTDPIFASDGA